MKLVSSRTQISHLPTRNPLSIEPWKVGRSSPRVSLGITPGFSKLISARSLTAEVSSSSSSEVHGSCGIFRACQYDIAIYILRSDILASATWTSGNLEPWKQATIESEDLLQAHCVKAHTLPPLALFFIDRVDSRLCDYWGRFCNLIIVSAESRGVFQRL